MPHRENAIARLTSLQYLLGEALRVSDDGDCPILGAKISDCLDCAARELEVVRLAPPPQLVEQAPHGLIQAIPLGKYHSAP